MLARHAEQHAEQRRLHAVELAALSEREYEVGVHALGSWALRKGQVIEARFSTQQIGRRAALQGAARDSLQPRIGAAPTSQLGRAQRDRAAGA